MTFDWEQFLTLAENWYSSPPSSLAEATYRSVISRAYYSAYHVAFSVAEQDPKFVAKSTGEDHGNVMRFFDGATDKEHKRIATNLRTLREMRTHADYKNPYPNPDIQKEAQSAIRYALEILDLLKEI